MAASPKITERPDLILNSLAAITRDLPTFRTWAATHTPQLGASVAVANRLYRYDGVSTHEPGLTGWTSGLLPLVVLALGQSNMRSSADSTGGDQTTDPMVFMWNQNSLSNTAMVAGTQFLTAAFGTAPLNIGGGPWANSIAFNHAKKRRAATGRPVYVIQIAAGSHHIQSFIKPATRTANGWSIIGADQDLSTFMYPGIATALALVPGGRTTVDEVIWAQGEANQSEQVEIYAAMFVAAMTDLSGAGLVDLNVTPIAISKLMESAGNPQRLRHYNAVLRAQEDLPTLRVVDSAGLPPAVADEVHYTGAGLCELGARFASAIASPPVRLDYNTEPVRLGVDYGLRSFTAQANLAESDLAKRPAMPYASTLTIENNATLGWCFRSAANTSQIFTSRRIFPVPAAGGIQIAFEALTTVASATIDMRISVSQFTAAKVFTSSKNYIPPVSVLTDAMGRTVFRARIGRSTTEADMALDAGTEYFSYNVFIGSGADDETFAFNLLDMSIVNPIATVGALGPRVDLTGLDLACKMTAPAVITGAATLTNADLRTTLISYTGAAAAVTFPLGTTLDSLLAATDTAFEFSVINTGSGTATMTANTGVTLLGAAAVAAATSARWAVRRTAASTYIAYRLS